MEALNDYCIFITKKREKCNCKIILNKKFCYKHSKYNKLDFFDLLHKIFSNLSDLELINISNINKVFNYITDNNIEARKNIFCKIINYLYSANDLIDISINNNIIIKKKKKSHLIINIYSILSNTENIGKLINIHAFKNIQKKIKNNIINYNNIDNVTHENDPFTLENIKDIPDDLKFYFRDEKIYCFNIKEFEYYLRNSKKNPYTNNIIKEHIIDKLKKYIIAKNIELIKDSEYNWKSINQAYTDVVYYMEKIGFYNNILWFIELNYIDVVNSILYYKELSVSENIGNLFFDNILDILNEDNYHYEFAKVIINLFKDGNNHFILCCNFIKALGNVSKKFESNIPEWLNSTRYNYLNIVNNNFLTILLNNYVNNSNVIYANIGYDNYNDNDNDNDNDNIETTTLYYLIDYINRTT